MPNMNILIETLYVYVLNLGRVKFLFLVIVLKNIYLDFFMHCRSVKNALVKATVNGYIS